MSEHKPDLDVLALAGMTKAGLRSIDSTSVGGQTSHADKINLRKLADRGRPPRPQQRKGNGPNLLKSFDFIEEPKSRPLGRFDEAGNPLSDDTRAPVNPLPSDDMFANLGDMPELPSEATVPELIPMPDGTEHVHTEPIPAPVETPVQPQEPTPLEVPKEFDFDLFQHATVKEILKELDATIKKMDSSIRSLRYRKKVLEKMLGDGDGDGRKNT